jgi:hypothetical protein
MQLSDRITGAVLVSLGAAAAWGGSRLPPVPGQDVGPAAFPLLIGFGLVACGVLIALGIPLVGWLTWEGGPLWGIAFLAAGASLLRWPLVYLWRWVRGQGD